VASALRSTPLHPSAIWVAGFTSALDDQKIKAAVREIQKTVQEINQSIGATIRKGLLA